MNPGNGKAFPLVRQLLAFSPLSLQQLSPLDLMSGSNSNMTLVANVAEDLDGTDPSLSPYTWTCPDVDPYSTIYFYQFNAAADKSSPAWTTRFTVRTPVKKDRSRSPLTDLVAQITSSAGETTAPPHNKQPNGDSIPWGIGAMRSGSSVTSREKHSSSGSTDEEVSDESYSGDDDEATGQRSSNSKSKGETDYDEEIPTTDTSTRKGSSASLGTSDDDSEVLDISEDDESTSSTKSGSSKPTLKDTEEDSQDSDAADSKNSRTQGSDDSPTSAEDEESELENSVSTSSRLKTVHSKPASTPLSVKNINVATPTLPLPSITPSAQPFGCAGGINATSSYCSPSSSANGAISVSKLDSRTFFMSVLLCLFGLSRLE